MVSNATNVNVTVTGHFYIQYDDKDARPDRADSIMDCGCIELKYNNGATTWGHYHCDDWEFPSNPGGCILAPNFNGSVMVSFNVSNATTKREEIVECYDKNDYCLLNYIHNVSVGSPYGWFPLYPDQANTVYSWTVPNTWTGPATPSQEPVSMAFAINESNYMIAIVNKTTINPKSNLRSDAWGLYTNRRTESTSPLMESFEVFLLTNYKNQSDSNVTLWKLKNPMTTSLGAEQSGAPPAGTQYNKTGTLGFSLSSANYRTGLFNRTDSLSMTIVPSSFKKTILNRLDSLSFSLVANSYRQGLFQKTDSLLLTFSSNSYRQAVLERLDSLTLALTGNSYRRATLNRADSLSFTILPSSYRRTVLNRLDSLALSFTSSSYRSAILKRAGTLVTSFSSSSFRRAIFKRADSLSITITSTTYKTLLKIYSYLSSLLLDLSATVKAYIHHYVWEEVGKVYDVCSILQQIGDSRAYLCVYDDGTWRVLIKGV